jgi:hypothetical protein
MILLVETRLSFVMANLHSNFKNTTKQLSLVLSLNIFDCKNIKIRLFIFVRCVLPNRLDIAQTIKLLLSIDKFIYFKKGINMNQLINTLIVASLTFASYSAFAEDKTNTKDSMDGLTQEHSQMSSKMMDTNGDGMISKQEFMARHEDMYSKMKQTNGGVSIKDMDAEMHIGTTKGNKLQPSDTKNAPPAAK